MVNNNGVTILMIMRSQSTGRWDKRPAPPETINYQLF